jgi:hypothetical protein
MTTNVPCPLWIDQLINRQLDDLLAKLYETPEAYCEHTRGEIHALETILGILRMSSIASEK